MELENQNILFFTRTMGLGGTEKVVLQLCEIFKPLVHLIVVCSCGGENVRNLEKMGIQHILIPDIENKLPHMIWEVAKKLKKIIKEQNITVIHTHHRMAAFYVAALHLYKGRIFINTSHNIFTDKKILTAFAYRNVHLIACGEMVKQNLFQVYGLPENQIMVIRNAVQPFNGSIEEEKTIRMWHDEGCFIIGNIGRLSEQKGMRYFLKAIPDIIRRYPESRFAVVGNGEEEKMLRTLTKELSIERFVWFAGYRTDVQNLMSQMDLIVLSSLWEGMPLTPLEAFSVRKTVIATAIDGTVEIIRDSENGYLIPPMDPLAIAEKVIDLIEHPEKKRSLETEGYYTFLQKFNFETFSEKMQRYYQSL